MFDDRAVKILFDTYWSARGWKDTHSTPKADFEYAKRAGVMFDPVRLTHAQIIRRAVRVMERVTLREVADAFVSSLRSQRLDQRSALGSFATMAQLRKHRMKPLGNICSICGEHAGARPEDDDLNVLNFERLKWGGVRHHDLVYTTFDLEQFMLSEHKAPTDDDIETLRDILRDISQVPPRTTGTALPKLLGSSVRGSLSERQVLVAILGYCDVLGSAKHPGLLFEFVPPNKRICHTEMGYPAGVWRGSDGVNERAVRRVFGHLL